jgi:hypothetical protein
MERETRKGLLLGLMLIVLGAALLLSRLHVLDIGFWTIFWPLLMLLGMLSVVGGFSKNRRGKIFWGTVLFLYALYFFMQNLDFLELRGHVFPPATFLIFGIAFLMLFVNNLNDWYFLIPSLFLGLIGLFLIMADYGYLYRSEVWEAVHVYWPIALILIGIGIILRRKSQPPQAAA